MQLLCGQPHVRGSLLCDHCSFGVPGESRLCLGQVKSENPDLAQQTLLLLGFRLHMGHGLRLYRSGHVLGLLLNGIRMFSSLLLHLSNVAHMLGLLM